MSGSAPPSLVFWGRVMSWDATLEYAGVEVFSTNYTHNTNRMMRLRGKGPEFFHGRHGSSSVRHLDELIDFLSDPKFRPVLNTLEPKNNWGSRIQLLEVLLEWKLACMRFPKAIIQVSM